MTTQLTLTHEGAELVVVGDYLPAEPAIFIGGGSVSRSSLPSEFRIERVEQDGVDVTDHYRRTKAIWTLEDMAREQIEES